MNVITLTGNATRDFELKYTPNGKPVGNGTIAVRRDYKNQQGEYETDFINLVVLGKLSEVMANHVHKGDKFGVTGRLQIRKWEKDGKTSYFTEVVVNGFDFPNKAQNNQSHTNTSSNDKNRLQGNQTHPYGDPFQGEPIDEDMLPF